MTNPLVLPYFHSVYDIPLSLTPCHTSLSLSRSVQLIFSILLQHHISKLSRYFWSNFRSVQISAPHSKCRLRVSTINLGPFCGAKSPSVYCWMLLLPRQSWGLFHAHICIVCYHAAKIAEIFHSMYGSIPLCSLLNNPHAFSLKQHRFTAMQLVTFTLCYMFRPVPRPSSVMSIHEPYKGRVLVGSCIDMPGDGLGTGRNM